MPSLPDETRLRRSAALAAIAALLLGGGIAARRRLILARPAGDTATSSPSSAADAPIAPPAASAGASRSLAGDWALPGLERTLVVSPDAAARGHAIPGAPEGMEQELPLAAAPAPPAAGTSALAVRASSAAAAAPPRRQPAAPPVAVEVPRKLIPIPDPNGSGLRVVDPPRYKAESAPSSTTDSSPDTQGNWAIVIDPGKAVLWVDDGTGHLHPVGRPPAAPPPPEPGNKSVTDSE